MAKLQELATKKEEGEHFGFHPLEKIKKGFAAFKTNRYLKQPHVYEPLKNGQSPKLMVISCSDSRVCPTQIFGLDAGEAFVVRSVANLVPPYTEEGFPATSAALEYAILYLKVDHIIVIGHSMCGGIKVLMSQADDAPKSTHFIEDWIKIGKPTRDAVRTRYGSCSLEQQCQHCEKESVNMSLLNLLTFPFVKDLVNHGELSLHGGYYDFSADTGYVARVAHDLKLRKSRDPCLESNLEFFPMVWESTGGATSTVHYILKSWTNQEADRCGLPRSKIRAGLYQRISLTLQREYARMLMRRVITQDSSWLL